MQFYKRWATALVAAPIAILVIYYSKPPVFFTVLLAIVVLCLNEYYSLLFSHKAFEKYAGILTGAALSYLIYKGNSTYIYGLMALTIMGFGCYYIFRAPDVNVGILSLGLMVLGVFYIGFLFSHLTLLRNLDRFGRHWVFFTLIATFMSDTCAAYVGTYLGKNKLFPAVSPGKTWEGFIGGCCGSTLAAYLYYIFFLREIHLYHCLFLGLTIGVVGLIGDLFESMIKRSAGAKDSGAMLPGHGGWLDRLDAVIFTVPYTYYYIQFFINKETFFQFG